MTSDLIARLRAVRETGPLSDQDHDRLEAAAILESQAKQLEVARGFMNEVRAASSLASAFDEENREGPWSMMEARARSALSAMEVDGG